MKIALFGINFGVAADPTVMVRIAKAAESAGLESLWTGEHVVLPDPQAPPSPVPAQTPFLDPAVALAHVAAHTERILLGTGIIILPQRNPVVLAKELASLDVVSGGRLLFGIGSGYLEPEFRAIGADFHKRGSITDDAVAAMKALWTMEHPVHSGPHFAFDGIDAQPRPVRKPHPPIVVGGVSRFGARRAARLGNGWYGFLTDPQSTRQSIEWIESFIAEGQRDPALPERVEISVTPPLPPSPETVRVYEDLGVDRLIAAAPFVTLDDALGYIDLLAKLV